MVCELAVPQGGRQSPARAIVLAGTPRGIRSMSRLWIGAARASSRGPDGQL